MLASFWYFLLLCQGLPTIQFKLSTESAPLALPLYNLLVFSKIVNGTRQLVDPPPTIPDDYTPHLCVLRGEPTTKSVPPLTSRAHRIVFGTLAMSAFDVFFNTRTDRIGFKPRASNVPASSQSCS